MRKIIISAISNTNDKFVISVLKTKFKHLNIKLTKKIVQIFVLTIFVSILLVGINPVQTLSAGYITRTITVTNSIGAVQTNYPVEATLNTSAEIAAGRMRSDCGDIRVYGTNNATTLAYAIIACNTTYTSIVFVIPSMPTGASTYFITFGDPALTSTATPATVFDRYEMFSTTAPTCTLGGSAVWDSVNSWLRLTTNVGNLVGTCNYSYLSSLASRGYKAFFDAWTGGSAGGADATWLYSFNNAVPTQEDIVLGGGHFTLDEYEDRMCYTVSTISNSACTTAFANTTLDNSTWRNIKVSWDTSQRRLFENGVQRVSNTVATAPTLTNTNFGLAARTGGSFNEHRVRSFAVMRFSELVTVAVGATNTRPTESISFTLRNAADTAAFANLCDFGTLTTAAVGSCQYRLKYSGIPRNGYSFQVRTSGNFTNGLDSFANAAVGSGGTGGTLIVAGTEGYGAAITAGSCTNGTNTLASSYNPGAGNSVSFVNTTAATVVTCNGPNLPSATDLTNTVLVTQRIAISGSTPPGLYTQTVTWTAVPNY